MTSFRIRPRFRRTLALAPDELAALLRANLDRPDAPCVGSVIPGHATFRIPPTERHYWSPQLALSYEEVPEGTLVRGLYGPSPNVWTMFTFGYIALGVIGLFAGMFGLSQVMLGQPAPALWVVAVATALAAGLYVLAQIGQKIGVEQTFTLHHFFEEAVRERIHVS